MNKMIIENWKDELKKWTEINNPKIEMEYKKTFNKIEKEILSTLEQSNYDYSTMISTLLKLIMIFELEDKNLEQEIMLSILKWNCWDLLKQDKKNRAIKKDKTTPTYETIIKIMEQKGVLN